MITLDLTEEQAVLLEKLVYARIQEASSKPHTARHLNELGQICRMLNAALESTTNEEEER